MVLIPEGYAQCTHFFTGDGLPNGAAVTLGLSLAEYSGDADAAASDMGGAFLGNMLEHLTSTVTLARTEVKFGPSATGPTGVYTSSGTGGVGTAQAPPNVAYLVRKNTSLGGRAGRGRLFLPGPPEDQIQSSGLLVSGAISGVQADLDAWWAAMVADQLNPVVLHGSGSPLTTPTVITSFTIDSRCATQRQRNRR